MSAITIIECTDPAELYMTQPSGTIQPVYLKLDLRDGQMWAIVDAHLSPRQTEDEYNRFVQVWGIPLLTAQAANDLMETLRPYAARMVSDWTTIKPQSDLVAELGPDAIAAREEIHNLCTSENFSGRDLVYEADLEAVTNGSEVEEFGITPDTSNARIDEIASEITTGLVDAFECGHVVAPGLSQCLRELRDDLSREG
ncbi:hypothetical protein [Natronoglycomyces albus]|uniref:Uncharacterized protein n=1 Tax=Natronoglycomyces albus TaxID=2811108 RepID=A0A895XPQ2_9ACTN|nr:hypothetical protein [Natronoglycomyces albus]QSB07147.1 hypothetical protein JQS30_17035 [Natronoglycomyces albus]